MPSQNSSLYYIWLLVILLIYRTLSQLSCSGSCIEYSNSMICESGYCDMNCIGDYECTPAYKLECKTNTQCNIKCYGDYSCSFVTINATDAKSLSISSTGINAVSGSIVYCPNNHHGMLFYVILLRCYIFF